VTTFAIERRFRGPAQSANGGFTCGVMSAFVRAPVAEVTLRRPPPLERMLTVERHGAGAVLLDGWPLESAGRKHGAGTALLDADGRVLARGRAVWIDVRTDQAG
jgi:hypothetical protein